MMQLYAFVDGPGRAAPPHRLRLARGTGSSRTAVLWPGDSRDAGQQELYLVGCLTVAHACCNGETSDDRRERSPVRHHVECLRRGDGRRRNGLRVKPDHIDRIDAAVQSTFANLVELQLSRLGHRGGHRTSPSPRFAGRQTAGKQRRLWRVGSARWCGRARPPRIASTPGPVGRHRMRCTATVSGEPWRPHLEAVDGSDVRNLLYRFEGCFGDTT